MRKNIYLLLIGGMITISSCYKYYDDRATTNSGNGNPTNPINNTGCKDCAYVPSCGGQKYTYSDTSISNAVTVKSDSSIYVKDTTIDGKVYRKLNSYGSTYNNYINCTNGVSTVITLNANLGGQTVPKFKRVFLRANDPVGATWSDTVMVGTTQNEYHSEIAEKNLTISFGGKTYTDVIHVYIEAGATYPGLGYIAVSDQNSYYARNVGLIYSSIETLGTGLIYKSGLTSYFVP